MDEMFRIRNDSYEIYEELLLKRDQLEREAASIRISYFKEFGDLITESFNLKVECIKKKKTIAYCQQAINRGEFIDMQAVNEAVEEDMELYNLELEKLMNECKFAKESKISSSSKAERARKIYRRIAKRIHPDIYPEVMEYEELIDLWQRTVVAYHMLDADELADLEVLINRFLREIGEGTITIDIPDIEDRIDLLEQEINEILTTEPYTYEKLLRDELAVAEKKSELKLEILEYEKYLKELSEILNNLLAEGGATFIWRMN
ncbi:hypothetical protein D6856_02495 [Butyrivibrio sp. XB500-5]|uniref:hypothetical protein n=1 Tax=Butyrivibrio sp. XB500-5 TaxID=2364880 RepID=UPI000EA8920D|nr:hypothetical protein [Butyrivibrio sp. XB500-5]RKM63011.1 hypothetical protein D6856_02495 [Butyrivibrio sp. XB500-5]